MTDDETTITGDPDPTDVEVPDDADYYYCPDCGWTANSAPVSDELGNNSTGSYIVQCGNCGHEPIYVNLHGEGYVPDPTLDIAEGDDT